MNKEFVKSRYGKLIDLGECAIGRNLNLVVLRGFAPLDRLAVISDADVYDQVDNPMGTQRNIKKDHARECLAYALDSIEADRTEDPHFFPEILLNARDSNVIELYDIDDPEQLFDLDSYAEDEQIAVRRMGVRIGVSGYSWPKLNRSPLVSRVDGNHRLFGTDELLNKAADEEGELPSEFPLVAFSLLIGLDPTNEARLFRDINGEHKGMETTHLDSLEYRTTDPLELKKDPKKLPLWIAFELTKEDRSFEKKVFFGGSKKGAKKEYGYVPPLRINSLRQAVSITLDAAPDLRQALKANPEALAAAVDNYWWAVKQTFPDAWEDRTNYILLQTIGFNAFARFGGRILDKALAESRLKRSDLINYLKPLRDGISLARADYPGVAGAGGTSLVFEKLQSAWQELAALGAHAAAQLLGNEPADTEVLDGPGSH